MKTKSFFALSIFTVSIFALTLLVCSESFSKEKSPEAAPAVSDSAKAADNVAGKAGPQTVSPYQNLEQMKKTDPEMYNLFKQGAELDLAERQLAMQYRNAVDEKAKAEISARLAELVGKHFDVRQQRRALELERLEKELNRMKDLLEKRKSSRDEIIEKRVKTLKGEQDPEF